MKRWKLNMINGVLLVLLIAVAYVMFRNIVTPELKADEVTSVSMSIRATEDAVKHVTGKDDMRRFIKVFNSIDLRYSPLGGNPAGWAMKVQVEGEETLDILVQDDMLRIGKSWYKADRSKMTELLFLYPEFSYPATNSPE
ncbi:hypothetical protein [Youngiibacter multivorans]|uniref:Uncharacterized protein n=1 Tax=Youngiibacter multivorans TaxID=937251 RepID=A0ABS4G427_9CLOT|nr:hypothetical protein [Youngiibacter multivorans]MBP1919085.1 hypothetical protein [Youngiibacter multivorans]